MIITPLSKIMLGTAKAEINATLKQYSGEELNDTKLGTFINEEISTLHEELGKINADDYKFPINIPSHKYYSRTGITDVDFGYNAGYRMLILNKTDAVWYGDYNKKFDTEWIGSAVTIIVDPGGDDTTYNTTIESIYSDNRVILTATVPPIPPIFGGTNISVYIDNSNSMVSIDDIDLNEFTEYDHFESIRTIECTAGKCIPKDIDEFYGITKSPLYNYSKYNKSILYCRETNILHFSKGLLSSYGNRIAHCSRNPIPALLDSDYLDIKKDKYPAIKHRAAYRGFNELNQPVPEFLLYLDKKVEKQKQASQVEQQLKIKKEITNQN